MDTKRERERERQTDTLTHKWWEMKVNAVRERERESIYTKRSLI